MAGQPQYSAVELGSSDVFIEDDELLLLVWVAFVLINSAAPHIEFVLGMIRLQFCVGIDLLSSTLKRMNIESVFHVI